MSKWKVVGRSDDVLTCECCGRPNLKMTVILTDGEGEVYFGRDCAARATGLRRTGAAMESLATQAQREADDRRLRTPVRVGEGEKVWVIESIGSSGGSVTLLGYAVGGGYHAVCDYAAKAHPYREVHVRPAR